MKIKLVASLIVLVMLAGLAAIATRPSLAIYISIVAVGTALALQKYVASFFGYFIITMSKMIQVGDRVRLEKYKGDVREIGLFHLVLDEVGEDEKLGGELTGKILHIPNLVVLDQPVINYSKVFSYKVDGGTRSISCEYVFDEIRVPLTNESHVAKASRLLEDIIAVEDAQYIREARIAFQGNRPAFLLEAENSRRILVHVEAGKIWIKGKYIAPFRVRNQLRTQLYL